jgi:hypothetical protein
MQKDDPKVVFDLQNEPHTIPAAQVFDTVRPHTSVLARLCHSRTELVDASGYQRGARGWRNVAVDPCRGHVVDRRLDMDDHEREWRRVRRHL